MNKIYTLFVFGLLNCLATSAQNLLINGDFEAASIDPWLTFVDAGNAAASIDASAGTVKFEEISNPGVNTYDIQLIQELSEAQIAELADHVNDTYHLSFDAVVSEARNCNLFFGEIEGGWTNLAGAKVFNFTPEETEYTYDIRITSTFAAMKFGLEIGTSTVPVEFDNISLTLKVVDALEGNQEEAASVRAYPNPVSDMLFVETPAGSRVKLFSTGGDLLRSEMTTTGQGVEFDVHGFPAGIYILNIQTGKKVAQQKIIIK